jgi:hypothetical protein
MAQEPNLNNAGKALTKLGLSLTCLVWVAIPMLLMFACGLYVLIKGALGS